MNTGPFPHTNILDDPKEPGSLPMKCARPFFLLMLLMGFAAGGSGLCLAQTAEEDSRQVEEEKLHRQVDEGISRQVERDIEQILDEHDPEAEEDPEELIRQIEELLAHPVNINRATDEELMRVPGMTWSLAGSIIDYRKENKPFASVEDLTAVRGIGPVTKDRFRPYLTVGTRRELTRDLYLNPRAWVHNGRSEIWSRYQRILETPEGYRRPASEGGYLGSPVQYYQRFHYRSDHLMANLTQVKYPGEELKNPIGFTHQSGYLSLQNLGRLQMLVAGNYRVRFGQGLILGSGFGSGKGQDVIRLSHGGGSGISGVSSGSSSDALRGLAATWGDQIRITGFLSSRRRTASVVNADTIRFPVPTPRNRTQNERSRHANTIQQMAGGRIQMQLPVGVIGGGGYLNRFSRPVQSGTQPWQIYSYEGRVHSAVSIDYRMTTDPARIFGEAGLTANGATGLITGVEMTPGEETELTLVYRMYEPDFQSIFGSSVSEQSGHPQNEEGWYFGIRHRPHEKVRLSAYIDRFHFEAPRFQTRRPSDGYDWLGMVEYLPDRQTETYLLVRQKIREQDYLSMDSWGRDLRRTGLHDRMTARFHLGKQIHPSIRLRSRMEWTHVRMPAGEEVSGLLLYQDLRIQATPRLRIDTRATLFDTDDYASRMYQYENDLLYVFSSSMLYDQGQRFYLLLNYQMTDRIQIWAKISATVYENRHEIGSGLNRVPQNIRRDIGLQARVRL